MVATAARSPGSAKPVRRCSVFPISPPVSPMRDFSMLRRLPASAMTSRHLNCIFEKDQCLAGGRHVCSGGAVFDAAWRDYGRAGRADAGRAGDSTLSPDTRRRTDGRPRAADPADGRGIALRSAHRARRAVVGRARHDGAGASARTVARRLGHRIPQDGPGRIRTVRPAPSDRRGRAAGVCSGNPNHRQAQPER